MNFQDYPDLPPKSVNDAVWATLCFFDVFCIPLKLDEIHKYLLYPSKVSVEEIELILKNDSRIIFHNGYYFANGSENNVKKRQLSNHIASKYYRKLRRYLPFVAIVPFIRTVVVCNTLAFGAPSETSDIDLFIVTTKGRIFIARTLVTFLFQVLGVRRFRNKIAGRFCLSFFVSEDAQDLSALMKSSKDVYFLFWMKTLKPVYGQGYFMNFISNNLWLSDYFPHSKKIDESHLVRESVVLKFVRSLIEFILNGFIGDSLEKYLCVKHLKRHENNSSARSTHSSVVVSETMLKYHNIDRRDEYRDLFYKKYLG